MFQSAGLRVLKSILLVVLSVPILQAQASGQDRLYGKITTRDGEILEGLIRWGSNEAGWIDLFNGNKEIPREYRDEIHDLMDQRQEESTGFTFLGIRFGDDPDSYHRSSSSAIRFGHLRTIEVTGRNQATLTLKSGAKVEFDGGSSDMGRSLTATIEDKKDGTKELEWRDIELIEFRRTPEGTVSEFGSRLYGTVKTRKGVEFTGYVTWDADEVLAQDVLDGEERGRTQKIAFAEISSIRRQGWNGATVTLKTGEAKDLDGTNDVDDDNRGIYVSDPAFGQINIGWEEFEELVLKENPGSAGYDSFTKSKHLSGTVYTEDGVAHKGRIRWDNDEEYTWEMLDGEGRDTDFDIEFGLVKSIEKNPRRGALVTVSDGRTFDLSRSNDVDEDNKGIIIEKSTGGKILVLWEDFERVVFDH